MKRLIAVDEALAEQQTLPATEYITPQQAIDAGARPARYETVATFKSKSTSY